MAQHPVPSRARRGRWAAAFGAFASIACAPQATPLPLERLAAPAACDQTCIAQSVWTAYRARFLKDDGRVVDSYTGFTHTEGQGTALILAAAAGDRAGFERAWAWTAAHLQRPDGLFSWKWDPASTPPVSDRNNASDGDLMIAWGLHLGAERWGDRRHAAAAASIVRAVEAHLIVRAGGRFVLLPGKEGFTRPGSVTLNPSYYVYPALDDLTRAYAAPLLARAAADGVQLLETARFGGHGLPGDWIRLNEDGSVLLEPDRPARFGYEAIRVPLYLVWSGRGDEGRLAPYCTAWRDRAAGAPPPSWIDLTTGERAAYRASNGFLAIAELLGCGGKAPELPQVADTDDYYGASLVAFATLAAARP